MHGNRIARFDTRAKTFQEGDLPEGARPHGLVVAKDGRVLYTGNGNGSIGELDPATGKMTEIPMSGGPYGLAIDKQGRIWVCRMGPRQGRSGGDEGGQGVPDAEGRYWYMGSHNGKLGVIE